MLTGLAARRGRNALALKLGPTGEAVPTWANGESVPDVIRGVAGRSRRLRHEDRASRSGLLRPDEARFSFALNHVGALGTPKRRLWCSKGSAAIDLSANSTCFDG